MFVNYSCVNVQRPSLLSVSSPTPTVLLSLAQASGGRVSQLGGDHGLNETCHLSPSLFHLFWSCLYLVQFANIEYVFMKLRLDNLPIMVKYSSKSVSVRISIYLAHASQIAELAPHFNSIGEIMRMSEN